MTKIFCYEKGCNLNNNKEEICKSERIATGKLINKNNGNEDDPCEGCPKEENCSKENPLECQFFLNWQSEAIMHDKSVERGS